MIGYFNTVLEEETKLVTNDAVLKWHKLLKLYFSRKKDVKDLIKLIGFKGELANAIVKVMNKLRKDKRVISKIEKVSTELFRWSHFYQTFWKGSTLELGDRLTYFAPFQ